ncbi:MAG: replicative DNA helicase [Paracoccaceae bacterium]|nr:replicative DNA helicase [Paracoccaceae bacterium]
MRKTKKAESPSWWRGKEIRSLEIRSLQNRGDTAAGQIERPHNIDAEQTLLGALLINNEVFDRIDGIVAEEHFYDPVHSRIFGLIANRIRANTLASPITLKPYLQDDSGLEELGGAAYLARLAGSAVSIFAARDYAKMIHDLAIRRGLIDLGEDIVVKASSVQPDNEPDEQIVDAEQQLYRLGETGRLDQGFQSFRRALTESVTIADAAYQRGSGLAGISTGLTDLDARLGGLHKSDLVIVAGRPSMGKTALATNIAFHIASRPADMLGDSKTVDGSKSNGSVVGFFSLEMSREQLATRVLSELARCPSDQIRRGRVNEAEFRRFVEAAQRFEAASLFIDDTPALPINQLASRARRLKRTHGLDLLVVDYLQLVRPTTYRDSRVNEITEITQGLKSIAKELDIPVLALSQLSRQVENRDDKRPMLSDLRESGSIEQDADVVMFVYREEYYKEREKPSEDKEDKMASWQAEMDQVHGKAEVIIGKQRHGPIGTVDLSFESQFTKFGNLARDEDGRYSGRSPTEGGVRGEARRDKGRDPGGSQETPPTSSAYDPFPGDDLDDDLPI